MRSKTVARFLELVLIDKRISSLLTLGSHARKWSRTTAKVDVTAVMTWSKQSLHSQ